MSRRIVSIIAPRLREDHGAAFTLQLLTGGQRSSIVTSRSPPLCRDGSEIMVDLVVRREQAGDGRAVFVATLTGSAPLTARPTPST